MALLDGGNVTNIIFLDSLYDYGLRYLNEIKTILAITLITQGCIIVSGFRGLPKALFRAMASQKVCVRVLFNGSPRP